jgi:pyruvate dehydrogenase E1 component beta subunit
MLHVALEGARLMADRGVSCEVLDLRTLSPLDTDTIIESVKKTNRAVIVHEAQRSCGVAAEIAARINEKALLALEAPVERVTGFDVVMPLPKLEQRFLPDARRVADAIDRVMSA